MHRKACSFAGLAVHFDIAAHQAVPALGDGKADARELSPAPGSIPDDIPLAGRSFYLELSTGFQ